MRVENTQNNKKRVFDVVWYCSIVPYDSFKDYPTSFFWTALWFTFRNNGNWKEPKQFKLAENTYVRTPEESNERLRDLVWYIVPFDSFQDSPAIILTKKNRVPPTISF